MSGSATWLGSRPCFFHFEDICLLSQQAEGTFSTRTSLGSLLDIRPRIIHIVLCLCVCAYGAAHYMRQNRAKVAKIQYIREYTSVINKIKHEAYFCAISSYSWFSAILMQNNFLFLFSYIKTEDNALKSARINTANLFLISYHTFKF